MGMFSDGSITYVPLHESCVLDNDTKLEGLAESGSTKGRG